MRSILEAPSTRRQAEFLAAVRRSRKLHHPWVALPETPEAFERYFKRFENPTHVGFWVLTEEGEIAGGINISEIVRGVFQSGYLGYYVFVPHNGHGYMTRGLRAVVSHAFGKIKLHRLEANIQPGNDSSRRLVERLGFRCEGLSPRYLKIAGRWRDHERWAITVEEWK
jgi:ribosomal-protein-alanine N-acetyltransferase